MLCIFEKAVVGCLKLFENSLELCLGRLGTAREQLGIKSWIRIIFVCSLPAAVLDWENKQVLPGQTQDRFYGLWTKFGIFGGDGEGGPSANWHQEGCNWKFSDFELDAKWRWNEEEKCSHAWSGLILVVCLIAASLREECLLLRCPPLLLTSPTNSQSGIDLGNFKFSDTRIRYLH